MRLLFGLTWSVFRAKRGPSFSTLKLQNLHKSLEENEPVSEKVPISRTGYTPPSPKGSVNSIVRYILLESGLEVHKYDALLQHKVPVACKRNKKGYESLFNRHGINPVGLRWSSDEENSVLRSWRKLVGVCSITDPKEVSLEFMSIPWKRKESYKKHVLGMYVGQGLNRHGNDSFLLWSSLMKSHRSHTFSKEEDMHIMARVLELRKGEDNISDSTLFSIIAKELNRRYPFSVRRRYELLSSGDEYLIKKRVSFSEEQDQFLLESVLKQGEEDETFNSVAKELNFSTDLTKARYYKLLFGNKVQHKSMFTIFEQEELMRSILIEKFPSHEPDNLFYVELQKKFKRNPKTLKDHWTKVLLPIIRSYEEGILDKEWKHSYLEFMLNSISDPNSPNYAAKSPHEINYGEVFERFRGQTKESLKNFLFKVINQFKDYGDFEEILKRVLEIRFYDHKCFFNGKYNVDQLVELYKMIKSEIK